MLKISKNKRGDVTDMLIFLILIFVFAMILFIFTFVISEISDGLRTSGLNNTNEGSDAIDQLDSLGSKGIQRGFFLLFIGFIISTLLTSFLVRTHPIFMFLYIFVLGITIFIGTFLGNAYNALVTNPIFSEQLISQTLFILVMDNIITILVAVGALSMIIVFSKFSSFGRSVQGKL